MTAATPWLFKPSKLVSVDGTTSCATNDGGVVMNNTAAAAVTHMLHNKREFPLVMQHMNKEYGSKTRPDCPNASNPFHVCSHYCSQSSPHGASTKPPSWIEVLRLAMGVVKGRKRGTSGNGDGLKELGEARDVDPRCVNASNPFHKCANYCSQNMPDSFKGSTRGAKKAINSELWHARAGPLVSLPKPGSLVYYFPQGHSEQVTASTRKTTNSHIPNYPSLSSQLMCQVHNVTLHADRDTDEIYAQLTLQPVNSVDIC